MLHIINLPSRPDRLKHILFEIENQGVAEYRIWPGVISERPAKGIALAHQQIIQWALQNNISEITIAEDDLLFTSPGSFNYYKQNKPSEYDLYLGGITYGRVHPNNTVIDFAGLHLYTIHQKFYNTFLNCDGSGNIDRSLKRKGRFIVCHPMIAIQRNGFSDNTKMEMDYSTFFKDRPLYGTTKKNWHTS